MVDDQSVLKLERLRDDLQQLKHDLQKQYKGRSARHRQVTVDRLRSQAARLAEIWLVDIGGRRDLLDAMPADYVGDLNVKFTRLLTMSGQAAKRSSYEAEINGITKDFTLRLVIPLKRLRKEAEAPGVPPVAKPIDPRQRTPTIEFKPTAFVGHSFAKADEGVVDFVTTLLQSVGIGVVTGKKPKADRISDKVKELIDHQHIFVGVFTRRDQIKGKSTWTTSPWVIDEKAYAVAGKKVLILLREEGVDSIGGLQGDYEYLTFSRRGLHKLALEMLGLFVIAATKMA
jgi:hypothetical protein